MRLIRSVRSVRREHRNTYLISNLAVYGVLAMAMIVAVFIPGLHEAGLRSTEAFLDSPGSRLVVDAYAGGGVIMPALTTLLGNFLFAALGTTTLPSLVIPFFGVVATIGRAVFIGFPYAPASFEGLITVIVAAPVMLLEFQAYVLAMLGSVILWRSTLGYRRRSFSSAGEGYLAGVRDTLRLYPLIIVVLLAAGALEAIIALILH